MRKSELTRSDYVIISKLLRATHYYLNYAVCSRPLKKTLDPTYEVFEILLPSKEIAVSVVVDPAEAILALRSGGGPSSVLHHEAGAELVQEPGGPAHLGEIRCRGQSDENEGHCQDSHSW